MSRAWLSGLMILASAGLLHAVERHVSTEYGTIQAAVDDCNDGDVVIIAPGSYTGDGNRDIQIIDKGVTVRSIAPDNPDVVAATVIDCNGSFESPEPGVYLSDFHIAFRMQVPYEAGQDGQSYDRSQKQSPHDLFY